MFEMSIAAFIAAIKVILSTWDKQYFSLDESDNIKIFRKYCKKELFTETYISDIYDVIRRHAWGQIIGVTAAEIYSRRARHDISYDYFCEGSGYLDVSFTVYVRCYDGDMKTHVDAVTISMYDVLTRDCDGFSDILLDRCNNSGVFETWVNA